MVAKKPGTEKGKARRVVLRLLIIIILFGAILATAIVLLGPAEMESELSAYGDSWNDVSKFRKSMDDMNISVSNIISSPTLLDTITDTDIVKNTLFIALGIEKKYTSSEAWAIYNFFIRGGKVIIADDFGFGNSVSDRSDHDQTFGIKFINSRLWDNNYEKNPLFVKVPVNIDYRDNDMDLTYSGTILLNEPAAIKPTGNVGLVLARSSAAGKSWVDSNENGERDREEYIRDPKFEGYPIIHEIKTKTKEDENVQGKAVFISDPSLFLNEMWDIDVADENVDNSAFCSFLVKRLLGSDAIDSGKAKVIFDESRHTPDTPVSTFRKEVYSNLVLLVTDNNLRILTPVVIVMFLLILIIVVDNPPRLRHRFDIKHIALFNLRAPNIRARDSDRIRALFLEKIRLGSGMSMDDFRDISASDLAKMVNDDDLTDFILDWDKSYSVSELEELLVTVRDWKTDNLLRGV